MKLKSCHINGFGIYKNKDFDFSLLNQYVSLNGSGKSTLADFIKFMFYDLPKKDERLKYAPYDDGTFGGSLVLEFEGKEYRIEKEFDVKSQSKDQERVYINNTLSDIKSLGNYLFKVDLEGFTRTIFINGNDLSISSNSTINSKLNSLVSKTEDDFDLKKVLDNLHDAKKLYGTSAKTTSLLVAAKRELEEKQNEYDELKKLDEALEISYKELKDKDIELNDINLKLNELENENEKASIYDKYLFKKNEIDKLLTDAQSIKNKYHKLLSDNEIKNIKNDIKDYNDLKLIIKRNDLNDPELLKLKESFEKNPIEEKDIISIEEKIRKIDEEKLLLKKKDQIIIKDEDSIRFEGVDVLKEIKDAQDELNNYNELNERIVQSREVKETKKLNYLLIPSIIFFIIFILGISLIALNQIVLGIVLMAIGLLCGILFLLLALKPKKNNDSNNDDLYFKYRQSEKKLTDILARYRYDDLSYEAKLIHLKNDYEKYKKDKENNNLLDEENKKLEADILRLKNEVEEFINNYLLTYTEYYEAIRTISTRLARYNQFIDQKELHDKNELENKNKLNLVEEKLKDFSKEFNISFETINSFIDNMVIDLEKYKFINNNINKSKEELDLFIKENNIDVNEKFEKIDLTNLKAKREELTKAHNYLDAKIKDNEASLERLSYLEAECNNLKERIEEYKHKGKIYDYVSTYLEEADNSLKEKYIKPLKDKFIYYASKLNSAFKDNITFDNDFNLKLIREGKLVDDYHLSRGEKTIAMLCYRLALVDNMYNDKPFIILDDPFVNLDSNNLKVALKLVKELSKETQIVYFTCIDTRKV